MGELEEIMEECATEKVDRIRKQVLNEMGPIGLLLHTRLNRLCINSASSVTASQSFSTLTEEEKEIIDSPD
jgi:hypothetical protein